MAKYLLQYFYLRPCASDTIKSSFEQILNSIGAQQDSSDEQSWVYNNYHIIYKINTTKTGKTLSYRITTDEGFADEIAKEISQNIDSKVKNAFLPYKAEQNPSKEQPQFRTHKFQDAGIIDPDNIKDDSFYYTMNYFKSNWLRGVGAAILVLSFMFFTKLDFSSSSSSSSSYSTPTTNTTSSFTSAKDVLRYIDGEYIYTSLGSLHVSDGSVYDSGGNFINNVIVDSYTSTTAIIKICPSQYGGYAMTFKVDKTSGNISRID